MKNFKDAFSLAELLLSIAIIGVVSAMGITIAKNGSDKAYEHFFYNGYINLYNTIAEIGSNFEGDSVNKILGTEEMPDGTKVITSNGIVYDIQNPQITMTVPQRKTRTNNGVASVVFRYVEDDNGYLVPLVGDSDVNLQDRRDLLVAYIDNGVVGRVKRTSEGGDNYDIARINYYTYRQAVCGFRGGNTANDSLTIPNPDPDEDPIVVLDCSTLMNSELPPAALRNGNGVLKFANPRKAR